jgi:low temperature requirement protein LtrA
VYAYAHLLLIVGIVLFAFAMKTIVGHVGEQLDSVTACALCGGSALYLLAYSAIRVRVERRVTVSSGRFVAALALLLVIPLATMVPAIAALAIVTAAWLALHVYELVWWREARTESRSALTSS